MIEMLLFSRKISTDEKKNSPKLKELIQWSFVQDNKVMTGPDHLKIYRGMTVEEMLQNLSENTLHTWKIHSRRKVSD